MKKLLIFSMIFLFLFTGLTACGARQAEQNSENKKLSIVATIFPQYDFARQIAGGKADVKMLLKPGTESHSYEPSPQDIKDIQNCDLFLYTGGENDVWVEEILNSMGKEKPDTLKLMDCVTVVNEEIVEGMEEHEEEKKPDEHVWTSPVNAIAITEAISELMKEKDSENAEVYEKNTKDYVLKLKKLDTAFREVTDNAERTVIVFGDRFPFRYLTDEYGLDYYAAFPGCAADTEASAATVAFLTDKVKAEKLPVVFTIEFSNGKIADTICEGTGAEVLTLHSCHNITEKQMEEGVTYLSLMQKNVKNLKRALN